MSYQLLLLTLAVFLAGLLLIAFLWRSGKLGFNILLFLDLGLLGRLALQTLAQFQTWMSATGIDAAPFSAIPLAVYLGLLLALPAPFIYLWRSMKDHPGYLMPRKGQA